MTLNDMSTAAYGRSCSKGFHEDPAHENVGEKLMLITSELGEALEAVRKRKVANLEEFEARVQLLEQSTNGPLTVERQEEIFRSAFNSYIKDTFEDEIADAVIRIGDLCGWKQIDLDKFVALKMRFNAGREYKHGKAF